MIFLNVFSEWIKNNPAVSVATITITGSLLGFLSTRVYDRFFSENFLTDIALLEKLRANTISVTGVSRLNKNLLVAIKKLQHRFDVRTEIENQGVLNFENRFYAKDLTSIPESSNCPTDSENKSVFFFDSEKATQNVIYDLDQLVVALENEFKYHFTDEHDTDGLLFKNIGVINAGLEIIFWVKVINFFPSDRNLLNREYNTVHSLIKRWIPSPTLILELYVPDDIIITQKTFVNDIAKISNPNDGEKNAFVELILKRNQLIKRLLNGYQFGELLNKHKSLPDSIVSNRLLELKKIFHVDIINVFGEPGTGKTYLANRLIKAEVENGNLFITFGNSDLINAFYDKIKLDKERENFYNSIIELLADGNYNFIPSEYAIVSDHRKIARFAFNYLFNYLKKTIYIVIDDYYLYREFLENKIVDIQKKQWGVKFLIIGRPPLIDLNENVKASFVSYECKSWNRSEAVIIIQKWTDKTTDQIEEALKIDWLIKENKFSIYLIRLIVNNLRSIQYPIDGHKITGLSDILRNEIISSIKPVFLRLVGVNTRKQLTSDEIRTGIKQIITKHETGAVQNVIDEIKILLEKEVSIDIDTFINKIGELSWASRFQVNRKYGGLSIDLLQTYLPFLDARDFKKVGIESNIFIASEGSNKLDWNDNLLADGCLSVLLRRNLENIGGDDQKQLEFSGMLEGLRSQYSLNIISLVLDSNAIVKIAKVVVETNLDRIDVVDELLTDQNIDRLRNENKVEELASSLIKSFDKNQDGRSIVRIAKLVKKLSDVDLNYKKYLEQIIGLDLFDSKVSQYIKAIDIPNNKDFYDLLDGYSVNKVYSTRISIEMWQDIEVSFLINRFLSILKYEPKTLKEIGELWLSYLGSFDALITVEKIETFVRNTEIIENEATNYLLDFGLNWCREKRTLKDEIPLKKRIIQLMANSWMMNRYTYCETIAKYVIFFERQPLFRKNVSLKININEKYFIPSKPYGPNKIVEILSKLPKGRFILATSQQIIDGKRDFGLITEDALELVIDNINNLDIHCPQLPENFKLCNFSRTPIYSETAHIEDLKQNSIRTFYWRPVFYLT